ncbi:hypothetical protein I547_7476 [Mycobacterium kansasii 824]|uniref:Uncharacterized protein n=1 Tax=Mycobacterium kansasii TaxID=1768 RepID=A0A1V3XAP8_MYCKA|nr:hypothetical protein I547_7476 [Mycobacterium kansasii 824]OOK76299.1 hypothetical protein BZL30_3285 [Mycobacterium kansasii]
MRRMIRPHVINQVVYRNRVVDVDQQRDQYAPLPRMTDVEPLPVDVHRDVAEQTELD